LRIEDCGLRIELRIRRNLILNRIRNPQSAIRNVTVRGVASGLEALRLGA
jgi:hypothetical protein